MNNSQILKTSLYNISQAFTHPIKSHVKPSGITGYYVKVRNLTQSWYSKVGSIGSFDLVNGNLAMAKKFSGWTFADIKLDSSDKNAFDEWVKATKPDVIEICKELHTQGYKVSSSFVVDSEAFCVTLTGTDDCKHNRGVSLTSWSDDLEEAFFIAAYKHFVKAKEGAWALPDKSKKAWG